MAYAFPTFSIDYKNGLFSFNIDMEQDTLGSN